MKRLTTTWLLPTVLLMAQSVPASSMTVFNDPCVGDFQCSTYTSTGTPLFHGGNGASSSPSVDIVGQESSFDILNMTVSQSEGNLVVGILTRFVPDSINAYGDLMLSTTGWHPFGSSPYGQDTATSAGTNWNYVVSTETGSLYRGATLTNSDNLTQDGIYRHNQYVGYSSGGTNIGTATVLVENPLLPNVFDGTEDAQGSLLTYTVSLALLGLPLDNPAGVALRWTTTGANDIVESALPVPIPASLPLFLSGLAGIKLLLRTKPAKSKRVS